jgi:perosamine synthetase
MRFIDPKLMDEKRNIVVFYPNVPEGAIHEVENTLRSRWIGQGPKVDLFEQKFKRMFCPDSYPIAVNSGTSALHLAYVLAGVNRGDEVVVPVFTCTATSISLLWMGAKPVFADINPYNLNINPAHVKRLITKKTKAITCVHYGGLPCDMDALREAAQGIPIIEDAAQALGGEYKGQKIGTISDYTCFSFQAIKHITTGDGGMLVVKDREQAEKAKRIRWFGIDRKGKQNGIWENDITEVGYKYQMTDISASMGLAGLNYFNVALHWRKVLFMCYEYNLRNIPDIKIISGEGNAYWLMTVFVDRRNDLIKKLREHHIESGTIHSRNDQYTIFGGRVKMENMDRVEDKYLVLPLHNKMRICDVQKVCNVIKSGW